MPANQNHLAKFPCVLAGDPGKECASFSRFILPFSYMRRHSGMLTAQGPHYERADAKDWLHRPGIVDTREHFDLARRQYLTGEMADVLFKRAEWFILRDRKTKGDVWHKMELKRSYDTKSFEVAFRPPAIVLFEWENERHKNDVLQTGFLLIEAFFPTSGENAPDFADVLAFNEVFRHWRRPYFGHDKTKQGKEDVLNDMLLDALVKNWTEMPGEANHDAPVIEDSEFLHYTRRWSPLLRVPIFNSDTTGSGVTALVLPVSHFGDPSPGWAINADDRVFVVSCVIVHEPKDFDEADTDDVRSPLTPLRYWETADDTPESAGFWIKQLNVDPPVGNLRSCSPFERAWVAPRTYRRWLHDGAAYGYTDHSMAMLSGPSCEPPTWRHFGQMYCDQFLLMLYVRASLFRFSRELSDITDRLRHKQCQEESRPDLTDFREEFARLRLNFDIFTNLYQFPLLSTQQQSIEMYGLLRRELDIEAIYNEVEREIKGTHDGLELEATQQFALMATLIGFLGLAGLLAGVVQAAMALAWFWGNAGDARWLFPASNRRCMAFVLLLALIFLFIVIGAIYFWRRWLPPALLRLNRYSRNRNNP